jgi:tetratricopeptide (TPR) repeat protein
MGGKAMNKYEAASNLNKSLVMAWIKIGRLAVNGHIWDQAIDAFNKALQIDKNTPLIHKELGTVYYYTKQFDKMIQEFKTYIDLSPGDVQARTSLLQMYFSGKDYDKVADEATKGLSKDPNNVDFLRFLIYSDYELKRYKDGYDAMKRLFALPNIKTKPRDIIYAVRLAGQVSDTTLAMSLFPQAIANDSANCDLLGEYAKFLYTAKHYDETVRQDSIKKARCGTLSSLELYYLGRAYLLMDDSIKADTTFGEFISRNPTSPDGYYWRARTDLKLGKIEDCVSLPYYEKYIEIAGSNVDKYKNNLIEAYQYGAACYAEKDKAKAKEYLNKVLELDPDNEFAKDLMKQLK